MNTQNNNIVHENGDKFWIVNELLHREGDLPAIEYASGTKCWYVNGEFHRENGPAIEYSNGTKEWFINGKCHREDGPAIERADGSKHWYINGERHREDGPAIERANGEKRWYLEGIEYFKEGYILKIAEKANQKQIASRKKADDIRSILSNIAPLKTLKFSDNHWRVIICAIGYTAEYNTNLFTDGKTLDEAVQSLYLECCKYDFLRADETQEKFVFVPNENKKLLGCWTLANQPVDA